MCRFIAYLGEPIRLSTLVTEPDHSIIHQSYHAREREEPLNGDGFGLAWYVPNLSSQAAVFKEITPAWSNENLRQIARVTQSDCIFAHVRAATGNTSVSRINCHPFSHGPLTFMHNGYIPHFDRMRRLLRRRLSDGSYDMIEGGTDSEHAFGVFCDHFCGISGDELSDAMIRTIHTLERLSEEVGISEPSLFNFALTDGNQLIATRYISDGSEKANSLYFAEGGQYRCDNGSCVLDASAGRSVIVASERLSLATTWQRVPPNTLLIVDHNGPVQLRPIPHWRDSVASVGSNNVSRSVTNS